MKNWCTLDTEDNAVELAESGRSGFEKVVTWAGLKMRGGRVVEFNTSWDMRAHLDGMGLVIWCHNLKYDLGNLFGDDLDELDIIKIGNRVIRAYWRGNEFRDLWNIFTAPLADIGQIFGLKKLKMGEPGYALRDLEITWLAVRELERRCEEMGIKEVPATAGSMAVKTWRSMGGRNHRDTFWLTHEAYIGGRTELFKPGGEGNICWVDVNSLYPWALTQAFPDEVLTCRDIEKKFGVIHCRVDCPEFDDFQILPVRGYDGRVSYPSGKFSGVWTFHEIRAAIERGAKILKVWDCYGTNRGLYPYRNFSETIYEKKVQADNPVDRLFWKTILNSFCGQLAVRGNCERSLEASKSVDRPGIQYGTKKLCKIEFKQPLHTNYLHAAYVNSYSRLRLLEFLRKVGQENVIYCDTDSILFFNRTGNLLPFETGEELGGMKVEGIGNRVRVYGNKMYQFGNHYVAKGIPKKHQKEFIENGIAEYYQPYDLKEAIICFDRGNTKKLSTWRKIKKYSNHRFKSKRLVGSDYLPQRVNFLKYNSALEKRSGFTF